MHVRYSSFVLASFLAILLAPASLSAQAGGEAAFRFVTATGLTGKVNYFLDGNDVNPPGYPSGHRTGLVMLPSGLHQIKARHEQLGEVTYSLMLKPGDNKSLILYVEPPKPAAATTPSVPAGPPPKAKMQFFPLDAQSHAGLTHSVLTLLQCTPAATLPVNVAGTDVAVERLKPTSMPPGVRLGSGPAVKSNGNSLCTLDMEELQEYVLLLFQDEKGNLQQVTFGNRPH